MHHALEIQEILSVILFHCSPLAPVSAYVRTISELPALARTCRAFKELALDVLWRDLRDLSPLVQCLPETSHRVSPGNMYAFTRPLTQTEWDVLQSYTCRIRSIRIFYNELDDISFRILSNPPTTVPLFPHLRTLYCDYTGKSMPLLHLPLPSLVFLHVYCGNPHLFLNSLDLFPKFSPNIRKLVIRATCLGNPFSEIESNYIRRWQNLSSVVCPRVAFDMDILVHLSRMSALTHLEFALSATLPLTTSHSPLVFSNLHDFALHSESLEPISRFLTRIRLPAVMDFSAVVDSCPSRQEISFFSASVQASNSGHTIERLRLDQPPYFRNNVVRSEGFLLCVEDLRPFMAFNLRQLALDIGWNVSLTDSELLGLAFAWPHLERLYINVEWGWNTLDGITPNGLLQLLQTCPSLSKIGLAIDTRGYTECQELPTNLGLTLPPMSDIRVPDSMIEADSVPAVAAFFTGLMSSSMFHFSAWSGREVIRRLERETYKDRWDKVYRLACEIASWRS